jgi:hypothetical protein
MIFSAMTGAYFCVCAGWVLKKNAKRERIYTKLLQTIFKAVFFNYP